VKRELLVARLDESLGTTLRKLSDGQITHVVEDQLRVRAGRDERPALDAAVAGQEGYHRSVTGEGFEGASGVVEWTTRLPPPVASVKLLIVVLVVIDAALPATR